VGALRNELEQQLGMSVVWVESGQRMVTGFLPVERLASLPRLDHFAAVTPVYLPVHRVGSVTTQGDSVIKADTFRSSQGFTGQGETVGVISDSVSQFGGGLSDSVATGDLPSTVNVLKDGKSGDDDEGRAMLEVVHDVAPDASLAFHTAGDTGQTFAAAIDALRTTGKANVIVDDI